MSGFVITDEMKRAAVIAHLEWEHHKEHWDKVVEAVLALVPHPPEGGKEAGEPIGYVDTNAMRKLALGSPAALYPKPDEWSTVPLYTAPIPARDTARAEGVELANRLRDTLTLMGAQCTAPSWLWDKHCDVVLKAADALTAPARAEPVKADAGEVAKSIASMVAEWVEGGIRGGTDWRNGLDIVIAKRLERLAALSPSPATGERDERIAEVERALRVLSDCVIMTDRNRVLIGFETDKIALEAADAISALVDRASLAERER